MLAYVERVLSRDLVVSAVVREMQSHPKSSDMEHAHVKCGQFHSSPKSETENMSL
jgi:hypothetical protein